MEMSSRWTQRGKFVCISLLRILRLRIRILIDWTYPYLYCTFLAPPLRVGELENENLVRFSRIESRATRTSSSFSSFQPLSPLAVTSLQEDTDTSNGLSRLHGSPRCSSGGPRAGTLPPSREVHFSLGAVHRGLRSPRLPRRRD